MALFRSAVTVGGLTLASRVLGLVRDILIAAILGAGPVADAFFVAFKLPNLFRRLFAEGAFNMAFVPLFARRLEADGQRAAHAFAEEALRMLLSALVLLVVLAELAMPALMLVLAPGFLAVPETLELAITLARITFPYLVFISLVSLMAGVLNSLGRFAAAAATPILLNLCLIMALLVPMRWMPTPAHALAWGVAGAGVLQLVWLYGACGRAGMWLRLRRPRPTPEVRTLMRRMVPVALGAGIYQINVWVDTVIASLLPAGSISYLFYADRVNQLPLAVVGMAVGTVLLPLLSRRLEAGDDAGAADSQNRALEFTFLLTLPAAAALVVIAGPVIGVLFQRGAFGVAEAEATAAALAVYAIGLPAYVLVKVLAPAFFARGDTATPVKVSVVALVVNVVLNLLLMGPFLHVGIAMATAISAWVNALILALILARHGHLRMDRRLKGRLPRILAASAGMAAVLWLGAAVLADALTGALAERILALSGLVATGLVVFALLAQVSGAASYRDLMQLARGRED